MGLNEPSSSYFLFQKTCLNVIEERCNFILKYFPLVSSKCNVNKKGSKNMHAKHKQNLEHKQSPQKPKHWLV